MRNWLNPALPILSIQIHENECAWVYGQVIRKDFLKFKSVEASGVCGSNPSLLEQGGKVSTVGVSALLEGVFGALGAGYATPKGLVFSLPSRKHFLGGLTVSSQDSDEDIHFQVQEVLENVAGQSVEPMAYDWRDKTGAAPMGERPLALAAIHQSQLDALQAACAERKLTCLGVTLDNIAGLNGYMQGIKMKPSIEQARFLLLGELNPHAVRLSIFVEGIPFHETWDHSSEGFSAIQAISAMEGLVSTWSRGVNQLESGAISLILGGSLMSHKSTEQILKRSAILSPWWVPSSPVMGLNKDWHDVVVPFGAVEGMPCG